MEVQILAQKENPLLKRSEVTFKAVHKAQPTPTRDALRTELAKHLKAHKETVIVDRAEPTFGRYETLGYAKVYKTKEQALEVERHHILVRNKLVAAEKKEEKPAEAAPAPPKAEKAPPKKEEPKAEAKPASEKKDEKPHPKEAHKEEKKAPVEKKEAHKPEGKPAAGEPKKAEPKKKEVK